MVSIEELSKNPAVFLRTTGTRYATFQIILGKVEAYILEYNTANPIHKRGRKPAELTASTWLLLSLLYMRQYHTFLSLGQAFSISESYAYKRYCKMRIILSQVLDMPSKEALRSGDWDKLSVDVSEQTIERPQTGQKRYYSGKKKAYHKSTTGSLPGNGADPGSELWQRPHA